MKTVQTKEEMKQDKGVQYEEKTMKGTMVSVGFVAFVIVAMWGAIFWLYMERV